MATIERLLAMGSPRSPNLERGGGRGNDGLSWEDVYQALGMLRPTQRAVLMLKARPDQVTANELAALCHHLMLHHGETLLHRKLEQALSGRQHTPAERALHHAQTRHADSLVRTALQEYQTPNTCRHCRATGEVADHVPGKGLVKGTCGTCIGKGWLPWSDNRRARTVGVKRGDWLTKYAPAYTNLIRELSSLYRGASAEFKQRLFGSDEPGDAGIETPIEQRLQARC